MKKFIIIFMFPVILFGQQAYRTILPNAKAFYQSEEAFGVYDYFISRNYFRGIKVIDTVFGNGYKAYKFFYEYHDNNYSQSQFPWNECVNMEAQCWLGPEVIVHENGLNLFFNRNYDSIFIKTQANLNDSWAFYITDLGEVYNAVVTDISEENFLGVTDFVKTITVTGEGKTYIIEISQNYGFLRTINFRDFPGFGGDTYQVYEHELKGLTEPALGFQPMTLGDIYDYEIGDIIHKTAHSGNYDEAKILKVIGKELVAPDTLVYTMTKTFWNSFPGGQSYTYDTINFEVDNISNVETHMPFESRNGEPIRYMLDNDDYNGRMRKTGGNSYFMQPDSCFVLSFELNESESELIKGVGRNCLIENIGSNYYWVEHIVYFKKGDETWGTPLIPPVAVNETTVGDPVRVFPNPVKDNLFVILPKDVINYDFSVYDLQGRKLFSKTVNKTFSKIDVSTLPAGIYFYRISSEKIPVGSGKIIVKK